MNNRLGIFVLYDDKGDVDDYVTYLLNDIKTNLKKLVVVCNGILKPEGRKKLEKFSDDIIVRPNKGFDLGAWKYAMTEYCGFSEICQYDEMVLFNDSFFGPLYPFKEIFSDIESRKEKIDFWALTAHGEVDNIYGMCPYGYRPRYLQTYFLVVKNDMLNAPEFQEYWINQPQYTKFEELCEKHEAVFTKYFEDLGYKYAVYSDTKDWESDDRKKNFSQHTFNMLNMLTEKKLPVIKRKFFSLEKSIKLRYSDTSEIKKIMKFIKEETSYDENLIYSYLLKRNNITQLKECFNWNFVLPYEYSKNNEQSTKKIVVIAHLYYESLFDYAFTYIEQIPEYIDVLITVSDKEKQKKLQKRLGDRGQVILVDARGRDVSAFLVGSREYAMKYDYICFLHDKSSSQKEYSSVGKCFSDLLWDCMLRSKDYIENVIDLLDENEKLGFLCPPGVYHGTYFASSANYWTINYEKTKELLFELNINVNLRPDLEPIALGNAFWCKKEAILPLLERDWEYSDFPEEPVPGDGSISHAIERCMPYVAQGEGYYSGWVMCNDKVETDIENYRYMFTQTYRADLRLPGVVPASFDVFLNTLRKYVLSKPVSQIESNFRETLKRYIPKRLLDFYRRVRYGLQ